MFAPPKPTSVEKAPPQLRTAPLAFLLATLLLGAAPPPPALAAEGISMAWLECPAGNGNANRNSPCTSDVEEHTLFPQFVLATPMDSVLALELVIDIQFSDAVAPAWWRLDPAGCRAGNLFADTDYSAVGACLDPWSGLGSAAQQSYVVGAPRWGDNQARVLVSSAVPSSAAASLNSTEAYYCCRLRLRSNNTVGVPVCAGCSRPACLVLNSVRLFRFSGAGLEETVLATPSAPQSNWTTWQGGSGASCTLVPVRNTTWGALKGLYR